MAKYDLPAMIEFVVNATKQPKIFYAGHSQGSFYEFVIVKYVCRYELTMCILLSMQFTMAYATEMILSEFKKKTHFWMIDCAIENHKN